MKKLWCHSLSVITIAATLLAIVTVRAQGGQGGSADGPVRYTAGGELIRPADYREWVFLSSGLNMNYGPNAPDASRNQPFNNVFVAPDAYRQFLTTGTWPERTIFVLEARRSEQHVRPNAFGYTQAGVAALEAAVKDTAKNGTPAWAYYSFDGSSGLLPAAKPFPTTASCQTCHGNPSVTAVEQTFVQFYPTLFAVAKAKGTINPTWDPRLEPQGP
jgi:hypothetical protein